MFVFYIYETNTKERKKEHLTNKKTSLFSVAKNVFIMEVSFDKKQKTDKKMEGLKMIPTFYLTLLLPLNGFYTNPMGNSTNDTFENTFSMTILGIYSICENRQFQTTLNENAAMYHKAAFSLFSNKNTILRNSLFSEQFWEHVEYEHTDVCESIDILVNILLDLLLDTTMYRHEESFVDEPMIGESDSKVVLIVCYINSKMSQLLANILSTGHYPVVFLNPLKDQEIYSMRKKLFPLYFQLDKFSRSQENEIIYLVEYFKLQNVYLVLLSPEDQYLSFHLENFQRKLSDMCYTCFTTISLEDENEYGRFINEMYNNNSTHLDTIFLFGNKHGQEIFFEKIETLNRPKTFIVNQMFEDVYVKQPFVLLSLENLWTMETRRLSIQQQSDSYLNNTNTTFMERKTMSDILVLKDVSTKYLYNIKHLNVKPKSPKVFTKSRFTARKQLRYLSQTVLTCLCDANKGLAKLHFEMKRFYLTIMTRIPACQNLKLQRECKPIICGHGRTTAYGRLPKHQTPWKQSTGWTCQKCPLNFIKPFFGNNKSCTACKGLNISNKHNTVCYDPFVTVHLDLKAFPVLMLLMTSIFGIIVTILLMAIFIKYRTTPVGRSLDLKMTFFHLGVMLLLFMVTPNFLIIYPTHVSCVVRLFMVTVLYTTNVAIIMMKSQKILSAFQSQNAVTSKEIFFTEIKQASCIIIMVGVNVGIVSCSVVQRAPSVTVSLNVKILKRFIYCDNSFYLNIMFVYFICLQLFCIIQAFRGRHLPDVYSESMTIVYGSFMTSIVFGVTFPIYYFQPQGIEKVLTHWSNLTLNAFLLLMIMYMKKAYIMLFNPHKNTKKYFQKQIIENVLQKVDEKLQR